MNPKKMWDEFFLEGLLGFRVEVSVVGSLGWGVSRGRIPDGQFLKVETWSDLKVAGYSKVLWKLLQT